MSTKILLILVFVALSMSACAVQMTEKQLKSAPWLHRTIVVDEDYIAAYDRLIYGVSHGAVPPLHTVRTIPSGVYEIKKVAWWNMANLLRVEITPAGDNKAEINIWEGIEGYTAIADKIIALYGGVNPRVIE